MTEELKTQLSQFLQYLAESIDIPDNLYERAERSYQSIGDWLDREASTVAKYEPNIYTQGSFRIGTVVKPITDSDEYDIDFVCELNLSKQQVTQKQLKSLVGNELISYADAHGMKEPVKEGRRCWTLDYVDDVQFHIDVLPAVPDGESFRALLESCDRSSPYQDTAVAITDNTHPNYDRVSDDWLRSNPKGYAAWFRDRLKPQFEARRKVLAESLCASVEDIPEYRVKTPLQQAVQLLKRHRDMSFVDDREDKPISIIITTLAAHSYNNEADLLEAMISIVDGMPKHIRTRDGHAWIPNPVNPLENFADKWREHPERETRFRDWLKQVRADLNKALRNDDIHSAAQTLVPRFGQRSVNEALRQFPKPVSQNNKAIKGELQSGNCFSVLWRRKPPWRMALSHSVEVSGKYKLDGQWYPFRSNSRPLPKRRSLLFEANTDVPEPFQVHWQVVNTGEEARRENDLRGEMMCSEVAGTGGLSHEESTSYSGMHWIECFIVRNGTCEARSGEFVVNIQ